MDETTIRDSILLSTKKMLGLDKDYHAFDLDVITHINSVFLILCQLGVGPKLPYSIVGEEETWNDFWGEQPPINLAKTYMYQKVRILFDPPSTGVLNEALERQIKETEWRMLVEAETIEKGVAGYGPVDDGSGLPGDSDGSDD